MGILATKPEFTDVDLAIFHLYKYITQRSRSFSWSTSFLEAKLEWFSKRFSRELYKKDVSNIRNLKPTQYQVFLALIDLYQESTDWISYDALSSKLNKGKHYKGTLHKYLNGYSGVKNVGSTSIRNLVEKSETKTVVPKNSEKARNSEFNRMCSVYRPKGFFGNLCSLFSTWELAIESISEIQKLKKDYLEIKKTEYEIMNTNEKNMEKLQTDKKFKKVIRDVRLSGQEFRSEVVQLYEDLIRTRDEKLYKYFNSLRAFKTRTFIHESIEKKINFSREMRSTRDATKELLDVTESTRDECNALHKELEEIIRSKFEYFLTRPEHLPEYIEVLNQMKDDVDNIDSNATFP